MRPTIQNTSLARPLWVALVVGLLGGLWLSGLPVADAQTEAERLEAELPERVQIPVLDVTTIQLVPRKRFEDTRQPMIGEHEATYAKERAWDLPSGFSVKRFPLPEPLLPPEMQVLLTAAPRVPGSFVYEALLIRAMSKGYGLAKLGQQFLSGAETTNSRRYRVNDGLISTGYRYREGASLDANLYYRTKDVEWLPAGYDPAQAGDVDLTRRDTSFLDGWVYWREPIGLDSLFEAVLDVTDYRLATDQQEEQVTDTRLKVQVTTPWPFLYPFRFGTDIEFYSAQEPIHANEPWESTGFRVYVHDALIHLGPLMGDARFELAAIWEPDAEGQGERLYYPNPTLSLTTEVSPSLTWTVQGGRTVDRVRTRELYLENDYTTLQPFLKAEKSWYGESVLRIGPKAFQGAFKVGVRRTDDLTVPLPLPGSELTTWVPGEMDVRILYSSLDVVLQPSPSVTVDVTYRHEVHEPIRFGEETQDLNHIPFRPEDKADVTVRYATPTGLVLRLTGQYVGSRASDVFEDAPLDGYFLAIPGFGYAVSDNTEIYGRVRLSIGEYRHRPVYELPQNIADFGVTLRF